MFGSNVRKYRIEKGLSQDELAALCGVSASLLSDLEEMKADSVTARTAVSIASGLGVSVASLFMA